MDPTSPMSPSQPPSQPRGEPSARPAGAISGRATSRGRRRARAAALVALVGAAGVAAGAIGAVGSGATATRAVGRAELTAATAPVPAGVAAGARVTVTGTATVEGTPDTLTVEIGATTNASSATGALDENDQEVTTLESVLAAAGVAKSDMQTSNLSLQPNVDNNGKVTGYQASDDLTVTVHDLARAGAIVDAAAHAVGNDVQIDGITFSVSNTSALLATARAEAVRDAQTRAAELAAAAGATLGPVVSIVDQEQQGGAVVTPGASFAVHGGGATPVPVQGGTEQISVQVQVVDALRS